MQQGNGESSRLSIILAVPFLMFVTQGLQNSLSKCTTTTSIAPYVVYQSLFSKLASSLSTQSTEIIARKYHNHAYMNSCEKPICRADFAYWRQHRNNLTASCLQTVVCQIGINNAVTLVPLRLWHSLSQVVAALALADGVDFNGVLEVLNAFREAGHTEFKTEYVNGILHGAIWYIIPFDDRTTIKSLTSVLTDDGFVGNVLHAVGHGLMFRCAGGFDHAWSSPPVATNISTFDCAMRKMLEPSSLWQGLNNKDLLQAGVANGLFHSFVEYTHFKINWHTPSVENGWMFPCSECLLSEFCFTWIFAQGMSWEQNVGVAPKVGFTPRYFALKSFKPVPAVCTSTRMHSESNVLGCIYGMSVTYFVHYNEGWVAHHMANSSAFDACMQIPGNLMLNTPSSTCTLLFDTTDIFSNIQKTRSSLVDWCSLFVKPRAQKQFAGRDRKRWQYCIRGASSYLSNVLAQLHAPFALSKQLCTHDLPWQAGEDWSYLEAFCLSRFHSLIVAP